MKKLKLEMEALRVESFEIGAGMHGGRGTVEGHHISKGACYSNDPGGCLAPTEITRCEVGCGTRDETCADTCGCPTYDPRGCDLETELSRCDRLCTG